MLKKIILGGLLIAALLIPNISKATTSTSGEITCVSYDEVSKDYVLIADLDGEGFVIELFKGDYNDNIKDSLNSSLKNKSIIIEFDDLNTEEIYDDIILSYYIYMKGVKYE